MPARTILVIGATGQTGRHFVDIALAAGDSVRALVRTPAKLRTSHPDLHVVQGAIGDDLDLDGLTRGVDAVALMIGDREAQRTTNVNTAFVEQLVPAMRRNGVRRLLYQAGGLSAAPDRPLSPVLRLVRSTIARGYIGQHRDNEAVMRYLVDRAADIDWVVHRAGIGSDGPSRGTLERTPRRVSIATFGDCAAYDHRVLFDPSAVHTCDTSSYAR